MKNKYLIIGIILILASAIIVEAQVLQTSLSGTAHWVTNGGIKLYSANATLNVTINGGDVNITGPLYIYSKGKPPVASFNLSLVGTKIGNNMVFNDTSSTATVLTTTTSELTIGEILYAPGWDGILTKNGHIKLDGDIFRPPEKGYLDILLTLSGDTI